MDEPPFALVCGWRYPLLIIAKGGSFSTVSTLQLYSSTSIACGFLYEEESLTHITITAYYNVDEAFLQTPTAAWGNLWDCRAALRKLVSSVYLESDLNLLFEKNGKFLFQLGYTPVVSDMKKIVKKAAASSFRTWTLAVWDMDTATLYRVKYDRSH